MVYFAVWPSDPEATGPYFSRSGHIDVFTTLKAAEAFKRRWCSDPGARVRRVLVTLEPIQPASSGDPRP